MTVCRAISGGELAAIRIRSLRLVPVKVIEALVDSAVESTTGGDF